MERERNEMEGACEREGEGGKKKERDEWKREGAGGSSRSSRPLLPPADSLRRHADVSAFDDMHLVSEVLAVPLDVLALLADAHVRVLRQPDDDEVHEGGERPGRGEVGEERLEEDVLVEADRSLLIHPCSHTHTATHHTPQVTTSAAKTSLLNVEVTKNKDQV